MRDASFREPSIFRVLSRTFLLRVVDFDLLSADADTDKLFGQLAAMLAAVSVLFTAPLILIGGRLPQTVLETMEHLLLTTTMLMVGSFSILSWDSIFPNRLDLMVLSPLPVRIGAIFRAKLAASAGSIGICILALNSITGFIWPLLFCPEGTGLLGAIRSIAAYWLSLLACSIFVFCCILALQGIASQVLPRQQFLTLSTWLQMASLILLLGTYILEPSLEGPAALTDPSNQGLLACLSSYWFLGLFQQLNGSTSPAYTCLAKRAWAGLAIAAVGATGSVLLAYCRSLPKIVEQPNITPQAKRAVQLRKALLPWQSAVFFFSIRTVARSRQHRVLLAFYLGVGFAIVLAYLNTPMGQPHAAIHHVNPPENIPISFIVASLLMMCIAVLGARMVLGLPIALRANWIFRMTEFEQPATYMTAARRSLGILSGGPIWTIFALASIVMWPSRSSFVHIAALGMFGIILVDLCLWNFRELPLVCSYLPGKSNIHAVFWGFVLFVVPVINQAGNAEYHLLKTATGSFLLLCGCGICTVCVRWRVTILARSQEKLRFEDAYPDEILSLDLRGRE
jgi:hypothetical protein